MKAYRNWRIGTKIFMHFFIIALVSAGSIGWVSFQVSSVAMKRSTQKQAQETVQQIALNLDYQTKNVENIAETISYNNEIQSVFRNDRGEMDLETRQLVENILLINYSPISLKEMEIYVAGGSIINVPLGKPVQEDKKVQQYISHAAEMDGRISWINEVEENGCMQLLKEIYDLKTMRPLGVIRIGLRADYLMRFLEDVDFAAEGYLVVQDKYGHGVVRTGPQVQQIDLSCPVNRTDTIWEEEFDGEFCLVIYERLQDTGLEIYGIVPLERLYQDIIKLGNSILTVFCLIMLLGLLLAGQMIHLIVRPIVDMMEPMKAASKGDFSFTLSVNSQDEIGQLRSGYNAMTSRIKSLIVDVYQAQLLQKESEFRALQAQINPHFLYNTLETINWMAKLNKMDDISNMVVAISNLMRISINNKRCIITVGEELHYVADYLYIQHVRYKDRLKTLIDVDPSLYGLTIPKLLLQPLVENAVIHGIEKKKSGGFIEVTGRRDANLLIFSVKDNGAGIPEEKLAHILEEKENQDQGHTSLGLITVHRRIQFLFGFEYGLQIDSKPGSGTTVWVRLPMEKCNSQFKPGKGGGT